MRGYDHYCPIARALDQLGDRWTLLILRELVMNGEQRFTDLRRHLPGIAPTLLTERLHALVADGLITTRELPPPAARTVYAPTRRGLETIPILKALVRWGMPLLEPPTEDTPIRPASAVHAAILAWYDGGAAQGVDERYRLDIDGQTFLIRTTGGLDDIDARQAPAPDLVLTGPARGLVSVRLGAMTLKEAIADGTFTKTGSAKSLRNLQRIFRVP